MSNIYQSLSEVMKRVSAISKDQKNTLQNYKFRGIDDVYNELHRHFADCGVFNIPRIINRIEEKYQSKQGAQMIRVILYVEYDLIALDGSKITIGPIIGEGNDSSDKASNKALSAAHKYALLQSFLIPTEDMAEADKDHNEIKFQPKHDRIPGAVIGKKNIEKMEKIGGVSKEIVNHAPKANEPITYKNFKFAHPKEFEGKRFDEIEWAVLDDYMNAIAWKYTNKDIPEKMQWFFDLFTEYRKSKGF